PFGLLRRERGLEAEPAHLLLQIEGMAAHDRTKNHRAAAELRRAQAALAGPPGALLLVGLFGRAADLADALGLVGAGASLGELPGDDARQDIRPHLHPEHRIGELDVADLLVVEVAHAELHGVLSSVASAGASSASSGA